MRGLCTVYAKSLLLVKAPFMWADVVMIATAYGAMQQGYYHLVVSSMVVLMFGGMYRYADVSLLRLRNLQFDKNGAFVLCIVFDHGCRNYS